MTKQEKQQAERLAERVAAIMGESSAAAEALVELKLKRALGKEAWLTQHGNAWCVTSKDKSPLDIHS